VRTRKKALVGREEKDTLGMKVRKDRKKRA
jgi:hypothetical protein